MLFDSSERNDDGNGRFDCKKAAEALGVLRPPMMLLVIAERTEIMIVVVVFSVCFSMAG